MQLWQYSFFLKAVCYHKDMTITKNGSIFLTSSIKSTKNLKIVFPSNYLLHMQQAAS